MKNLKCSECGDVFSENHNECPNCGCPASECKPINNLSDEPDFITTDTGYQQEETIKRYADVIWVISKIFAAVISIVAVIICLRALFDDFSIGLMVAVSGALTALSCLAIGILVKAVLYIYANISINVHEINMKIK